MQRIAGAGLSSALVVLLKLASHYRLDPAHSSTLFRVHGTVEGGAGLVLLLKPSVLIDSSDVLLLFLVRLWAAALLAIGICSTGVGSSRDCTSAAARSFALAMAIFHAATALIVLCGVWEGAVGSKWLCTLATLPPLAYLFFQASR